MDRKEKPDSAPRYRDGKLLCNARGNTCKAFAVKGREKCRFHGGATPRGPANPNFKHGKYSKYLPANIAAKYAEAKSDPELIEYTDAIALLDARCRLLLESAESRMLWADTAKAFRELEAAIRTEDQAGIRAELNALHDLVKRGYADSLRWKEIYEVIEREGRMKERAWKRLIDMEQMVSMEHVLAFVGMIMSVVTDAVKDTDTLRQISRSIDNLINLRLGQAHEGH
jgi:hypothetical protein